MLIDQFEFIKFIVKFKRPNERNINLGHELFSIHKDIVIFPYTSFIKYFFSLIYLLAIYIVEIYVDPRGGKKTGFVVAATAVGSNRNHMPLINSTKNWCDWSRHILIVSEVFRDTEMHGRWLAAPRDQEHGSNRTSKYRSSINTRHSLRNTAFDQKRQKGRLSEAKAFPPSHFFLLGAEEATLILVQNITENEALSGSWDTEWKIQDNA